MRQLWQLWEKGISQADIQSIISECETYTPMDAMVGLGQDGKEESRVRKSVVRWINKDDINSRFIYNLLWQYANEANRNPFGVEIRDIFDIQYTIYEGTANGFYDWHIDTFWANDSEWDRKLSITVQLSNPSDYEGGDFMIEPQYEQPNPHSLKQQGTVFVFPSTLRHQVTPVTSGVRKSLVAWVEGPKWK